MSNHINNPTNHILTPDLEAKIQNAVAQAAKAAATPSKTPNSLHTATLTYADDGIVFLDEIEDEERPTQNGTRYEHRSHNVRT